MTLEERVQRAERMLVMLAKAGHRTRVEWRVRSREQDEKINIVINNQIEAREIIKGLAIGQARIDANQAELNASQLILDKKMAELAESQKLTQDSLRAFLDSQRKRENGNSSN